MALNINRKGWLGLGVESTWGVPVAITDYFPFTESTLEAQVEKTNNEAAYGVRDKVFNSVVTKKWAEGDISWNMDSQLTGLFVYGAMGTVNSSTVSGSVKDHTFTRNNSNTPKSLTVVHDRVVDRQYFTGLSVKTLELGVSDGLASGKASVISKSPITSTSGTLATTSGALLSVKDAFFAFGSSVAAAAAATNLKPHNMTVTIENGSEAVHRFGSADPDTINHKEFEVTAEGTIYFESTTDRDAFYNNTKQAAVFKLAGAGIGAGYQDSVTVNMYQTRIDTFSLETGLADFYAESLALLCEYDNANSKTIDVVCRNVRSSY